MPVFRVVPCSLVADDGGSKHLWNVSKLLPDYTAQQPRRQSCSYSPLWEPQISLLQALFPLCHQTYRDKAECMEQRCLHMQLFSQKQFSNLLKETTSVVYLLGNKCSVSTGKVHENFEEFLLRYFNSFCMSILRWQNQIVCIWIN
jgi:hypothetical protein